MSNLLVTPELVAAAAADLAGIGSAIGAANAAAGAPTMALLAAGADEVSAAVAAVFSSYAQQYQALSAAAAAFHDQFVRALAAGAGAYAGAEAANVEQQLLNAINAPTLALLGRPLIGNGADGAAGTGQAGGAGGLLYGNGGNGGSGAAGQAGGARWPRRPGRQRRQRRDRRDRRSGRRFRAGRQRGRRRRGWVTGWQLRHPGQYGPARHPGRRRIVVAVRREHHARRTARTRTAATVSARGAADPGILRGPRRWCRRPHGHAGRRTRAGTPSVALLHRLLCADSQLPHINGPRREVTVVSLIPNTE